MDKETAEALEKSIEKWKKIEDGTGEDLGTDNCALCKIFNTGYNCKGCPVSLKSGKPDCRGTPYTSWKKSLVIHQYSHNIHSNTASTPRLVALAKAEREFLESLREGK